MGLVAQLDTKNKEFG